MDGLNLLLEGDVGLGGLLSPGHAARGAVPGHLLLRLLDLLLANLLTDGRFLHTKDVSTLLSQLLDLITALLLMDGAIPLLQPTGLEKPNGHVLLHLAGRDLLPRDGGHKILIRSRGWRQGLGSLPDNDLVWSWGQRRWHVCLWRWGHFLPFFFIIRTLIHVLHLGVLVQLGRRLLCLLLILVLLIGLDLRLDLLALPKLLAALLNEDPGPQLLRGGGRGKFPCSLGWKSTVSTTTKSCQSI